MSGILKKDKFQEVFPVPEFLLMSGAGLDICLHAVRYIQFKRKNSIYVVDKFCERPINIQHVGDDEEFFKELKNTLLEIKKDFKISFVQVVLPEDKAYVFRTTVPKIDHAKIEDEILFQLEENVPLSPDEAVVSFEPDLKHSSENAMDVVVTAVDKSNITSYFNVLQEVGITPLSFNLRGQAIANAVIKNHDDGTYILLNIEKYRSGLYVVSDGILQFSSLIPVGGQNILRVLMNELSVDEKTAESTMFEVGFEKRSGNDKVFSSMVGATGLLMEEIKKLYIYWHTHKGVNGSNGKKIEGIIFGGAYGSIPFLGDYISVLLKANVIKANPWVNVIDFKEYVPPIMEDEVLSYTAAIGAFLGNK